jgi:uncharacterized repeat protein (TIGR01451 family)
VVLRVALSLLALLTVASPALAQEITGTWRYRNVTAISNNGTFCGGGTATFSSTGVVTSGTFQDCDTTGLPVTITGIVSNDHNGHVTGRVGLYDINASFLPDGNTMVAVTQLIGDATGVGYAVFIRDTTTTFAQADLGGTWRLHLIDGGELPNTITEDGFGTIDIAANGTITGGFLTIFGEAEGFTFRSIVGGNVSVSSEGVLSGTVLSQLTPTPPAPTTIVNTFSGLMGNGKKFAAGTIRRVIADGASDNGFVLMQKEPPTAGSNFRAADLAGRWELKTLALSASTSDSGDTFQGRLDIDDEGTISGTLQTFGESLAVIGTATLDAFGFVNMDIAAETLGVTVNGTLSEAKNHVIGTNFVVQDTPLGVGVLSMHKTGAAPAPTSTVQFRTSVQAVLEGGVATVTVDRSGSLAGVVTVDYRADPGTASAADFTPTTGTLTFLAGQGSRTFTVATTQDAEVETDETVLLTLLNPTGGAGLGPRSTATLTIVDDETFVQFSQPTYTAKENVATAVITAVRSGALTNAFTVTYTATPLTAVATRDFKPVSGTLTFAANVASRTFSVPIVNGTLVDGDRSVLLTLGPPIGNAHLGQLSTATLVIQDDDLPGAFKFDKGSYTVLESAPNVAIIVRRTGTSLAGNVSVGYVTADGTARSSGPAPDYVASSGILTFGPGETAKTLTIPILKDNLVDGDKTFTLTLTGPSSGATIAEPSSAVVTIKDVDVGGVVKFAVATASVAEGAGSVKLTVVRSGGAAGGVLVDYTTVNGTATGGVEGDFQPTSGTLSFGFGNASATITIPIHQDLVAEGNETFQVQLGNVRGGATLGTPSVVTVTIVDDESAFQFDTATFTTAETGSAVVKVVRSGLLTAPATVAYATSDGTAVAGRDYTPVSGVLTFPANTPSKTFTVPILSNTQLDGNRSVVLTLSAPTGGAQLGTLRTASLVIRDDEQAGAFKLDKGAYTVLESAGFVSVTVMRAGTSLAGNVSVSLTATDGTAQAGVNYTPPTGALTFAPGQTSQIVKVPILRDLVITGPQTFTLALTGPGSGATLASPASATVTITEADVAGQIKFASAAYSVAESGGSVAITVQRVGGLAGGAMVDFTTVAKTATVSDGGGDFTPVSGTLTFGPGNTSTTITIPITRDDIVESNETFQVVLSNPRGGATLGTPSVTTVTIFEMDSVVQFSGKFLGNFPEVVRTGSLGAEVTVGFVATDGTAQAGSDYLPASGTLTFKPNVAVQYIPLTIIGDNLAEGSETFSIALVNPSAPARLGPAAVREFAIADNDFGGNVGFESTLVTVTEGSTVNVGVTRTGGAGTVLVVQWSAGAGSATPGVDFTPTSGSITFGPTETRKTFAIAALVDQLVEDPETVTLTLSVPEGAATLARATTTLRILDSPPVLPSVQFGSAAVSTTLTQDVLVPITRTGPGGALTVDWMATGGTAVADQHFFPASGTVTFAPADTTRSFQVGVVNGGSSEPDRTVVFGLAVEPGTATIGTPASTTLTIFGSRANVDFESSIYSVTEGGGPALVAVTRSGNLNRQVSVHFATSNGTGVAGTHYTATSGTLTFAIGQQSATFPVAILSNGPGDGPRTVNLTLSSPSPNTFIGEGGQATLQIREGPVYSFKLIADNTGELVGFRGVPALNDAGAVAFTAFLSDERSRVLRGSGGALTTIASSSSGSLIDFGQHPAIDAAGRVSFLGVPAAGGQGVFRGTGGALETLTLTDETLTALFDPSVSPGGNVAFAGVRGGALTLFTGPAPGPFAEIPNLRDEFSDLDTRPAVNDDGTVAFVATGQSRSVFTVDTGNVFNEIVTDVTTEAQDNVSINALGQVAVVTGLSDDGFGIVVGRNGVTPTPFVTLANGFQTFGDGASDNTPVINTRGEVGYLGLTSETFGIFNGPDPTANLIVRVGDPLVGSSVQSLRFGGINNVGQIAFLAGLADGRQVVVVASPPLVQADLAVTKVVSTATPALGGNVTFTITAHNNGPTAAASVVVTDPLPSGYTFVSATPSRGSYSAATGLWSVGTLAASGTGSTATLSLVGTVLPTGTYANTATIAAAGVLDGNSANNSSTVNVTPVLQADVAIAKTVDNATPLAGTNVTFTVTATNLGPSAVSALTVTDLLPSGYTFVSATPSQGSYVSGTGVWTVGALAAGGNASATLQITATVKASGVYTNTASRTASTPTDPVATNNTATVTVTPVSGLVLATAGPLVGVGRTISGTITLPTAAPAGGLSVALTTTPTGLATVAPSSVPIAAGQTTGAFTITGVAPGPVTINGTASGFAAGSVAITVTSSVISLGALPTLGPGQALSLPISLSTAAPAGGVTVSFASTNTNVATVTPSVFIPGGAQVPAANPQVTGVNVGTATINASAIGFAPDARSANVSVNVTFTPATLSVVRGTSSNITVNVSAPAPTGGLSFNLISSNTSAATVVSSVTVPAGQLSVPAAVTGVAIGTSTLQASGSNVTSSTATINVVAPPAINFPGQTIGKDMQVTTVVSLGAVAPAGGVTVTVQSPDATKVLLSTSSTATGSAQITLPVGAGSASTSQFVIQSLVATGTVTLTASAPNYTSQSATITLVPSGFIINSPGSAFTTSTLAANTTIQVTPASLNPTTLAWTNNQVLRGGITASVTVTATDQTGGPGVGAITTSPLVFNGGDSFKSTAFDPSATGTSLIAAVPPAGFSTPSTFRTSTATVNSPTLFTSSLAIGNNLQTSENAILGAPAPAGGVTVTVTSGDATRLLLSTSATAQGTDHLTFDLTAGASSTPAFFVQALAGTGTVPVITSAPGFTTHTATITLQPSGFIINSPGAITTTSGSANTNIQVTSAVLNPANLNWINNQALRGGIAPVSVTVTSTDLTGGPGVGSITTSPLVFNGGDLAKNTAFDPAVGGTAQVAVVPPTGFSTPSNFRTLTATVNQAGLTFANQIIGKDMMVSDGIGLGAPAPTGGVQITLTSADPTRLVLSATGIDVGTRQISLTVGAGQTSSPAFFIQSLASSGPVAVTATAPGYADGSASYTLVPSGFIINSPGAFSTTTFSGNTTIQVTSARLDPTTLNWQGNQTLRGGFSATVAVTATDQTGGPGVGAIVGSPVVFNGAEFIKTVSFDPAVTGTSLIAVTPPTGFSTPSNFRTVTATVTAPPIVLTNPNPLVGRDMQESVGITLGALPPGPVTVTVTVGATAVATIASSATVAGGNTVTFTNVTTSFVGNVFVQGRASSGTTTLTVQAPGYADLVTTITARPSGFIINSPGSFITTAGAGNTNIQITPARLNPTTLNWEANEQVRGGLTVNVTVTATDQSGGPGVGTITTSPVVFTGGNTLQTTQFDPAAAGTSLITVVVPSGYDTPGNFRQILVNVNP